MLEKQENVKKILLQQEHEKKIILEKIEEDNLRSTMMRIQKQELIKKRKMIKQKAQKQKEEIIEKFEMMKKKGKIDMKTLQQYGIEVSPQSQRGKSQTALSDADESRYAKTQRSNKS